MHWIAWPWRLPSQSPLFHFYFFPLPSCMKKICIRHMLCWK
jgi:hypothetical protein